MTFKWLRENVHRKNDKANGAKMLTIGCKEDEGVLCIIFPVSLSVLKYFQIKY